MLRHRLVRSLVNCTLWAMGLGILCTSCATPLERYTRNCTKAEVSEEVEVALEACRRAWINTHIGVVGSEDESIALYNLGRVLRKAGRLDPAETALKRSLTLEEGLSGPSSLKTGRRLGELCVVLSLQDRAEEGLPYLERLQAIAPQFVGQDRQFVALLFYGYAENFQSAGDSERAARLEQAASELGFKKSDLDLFKFRKVLTS